MFRVKFVCDWETEYDICCYDIWTDLDKEHFIEEINKADECLYESGEDGGYAESGHDAHSLVCELEHRGVIKSSQFVCEANAINRIDTFHISMLDIEYDMR